MPGYDFEIDSIVSVHQMVSNAIIMTGAIDPENDDDDDIIPVAAGDAAPAN